MSTLAHKYGSDGAILTHDHEHRSYAYYTGSDGQGTDDIAADFAVLLYCPMRLEEAGAIVERMDAAHVIVLNFESTSEEIARRLLDFFSGAAYARSGRIERLAAKTFALIPCGVIFANESAEF